MKNEIRIYFSYYQTKHFTSHATISALIYVNSDPMFILSPRCKEIDNKFGLDLRQNLAGPGGGP